ncbi:MAG: glycosyltransferase [Leptolyngbyaceae cyanobacterium SL_7_1]|nr:glycosyltransferase [Leptolyngbyaceae cyanobacterium SL_7_1]
MSNSASNIPSGDVISTSVDPTVGSAFAQAFDSIALKSVTSKLKKAQEELELQKQASQQSSNYIQQLLCEKQELQNQVVELEQCNLALTEQLTTKNTVLTKLRSQLNSINLNRARLINELHQSKENLRQQLHNKHLELSQLSRQHKRDYNQLKRQNNELSRSLNHLTEEIQYLSTGKAAIRGIIKAILRKIGIYNFVYRRYQVFVPAYNLLLRDRWQPATIAKNGLNSKILEPDVLNPNQASKQNKQALKVPVKVASAEAVEEFSEQMILNPTMDSSWIEAVVVARGLGLEPTLDLKNQQLTHLSDLVDNPQTVLCINPPCHLLPLLQIWRKRGTAVTVVACTKPIQEQLRSWEIEAFTRNLGRWMIDFSKADLVEYDVVCVGEPLLEDVTTLFQGRLSAKTSVILTHGGESDRQSDRQSEQALSQLLQDQPVHVRATNFSLYSSPPTLWVAPLLQSLVVEVDLQWPWNYPVVKATATLPSGNPWPKISIVTVTLNQGRYLEETLRSVLMQGYPNLEYIILDGGSKDETISILERYSSQLAYWVSEPDNGQSNALNKGFGKATGDILAWLNSDDCYPPLALHRVAIAFDAYQSDMVVGGCQLRKGNCPVPFTTHRSAIPVGKVVPLPLNRLLDLEGCWQTGEFFYQPEVFWTRELWQRVGASLNEDMFYSMDYELWLRMAQAQATMVHVPDVLALYRVHEQQKTYGDDLPFLKELRQINKQFRERIVSSK